uniref:Uncharacterized protein n=1 Tax=Anguilla anguilla TaxID=7936 RepID=A0A0E9VNI2_ANGAN
MQMIQTDHKTKRSETI